MHGWGKVICILLALVGPAASCLAASTTISVSATILSKSNCKFQTKTAALAFGTLNPVASTAPDVTRQATVDFVCNGAEDIATYIIIDDDGLHENGADGNRMQHTAIPAAFLPYSFSVTPITGNVPKGADRTLTVSGTVRGDDYRLAYAGAYTDVVVLSINP